MQTENSDGATHSATHKVARVVAGCAAVAARAITLHSSFYLRNISGNRRASRDGGKLAGARWTGTVGDEVVGAAVAHA